MARNAACPTVAALGRRWAGLTLVAAALAAAGMATMLTACGESHAESGAGPAGVLSHEACVGIPVPGARCHRLTVYENQTARHGRTIALRMVVLPATRPKGEPRSDDAVVYLAGGPGQAATEFLGDSLITAMAADGARARRDIVLADQRGTGGSSPLLCRFYGPPEQPQTYFDAFLPIEKVRACRAAHERTSDLSQYTTAASVEDLEAIRVALKYSQLTLVGGSYGTRLAMEYVRRYGSSVRAVVLESPVTPSNHAPERFGQLAQHALDALLDECLGTPECAGAFPAIREEARQVFDRLRHGPVKAIAAHPVAGRPAEVTLTRDHVGEAVRYLMYSSHGASRVPLYLHEAFTGNFSPFADFLIRYRATGTFDGLYLSITCAEDVPLVAPDAAERDDPTFLGGYRVRQQRAACAAWPRGSRSESSLLPVASAVPVLMTSGDLDPVTPPVNAETLARTLPASLHVRVPAGGHSPAGLTGLDCLDTLKRSFIERGRTDGLDTSCVTQIARPGFVTR
jgi:pimeloyl-ACP methyl ester carboxylesterase